MRQINQMMQQAQAMQKKIEETQNALGQLEIEGSSGGGMIKVIMTCGGAFKNITIDPSLVDRDGVDVLEDLIIAALHDAKNKADKKSAEEMSKITGGLKLDGFKLPF